MANSYGDWNPTTADTRADGRKHDAAVRGFTKVFNLATDADPAGGTANSLHVGRIRAGSCIMPGVKIASGANLSAINLSLGVAPAGATLLAAAAGPNATTQNRDLIDTAQGVILTTDTDVYLTPSGNWPSTGRIVVTLHASHR